MLTRLQTNFDDQTLNRVFSQIQDYISQEFAVYQKMPLVGGSLISRVQITSGQDNLISHNLGYTPTEVMALLPNVQSTIWNPVTTALGGVSSNRSIVNIWCSTSCVVSLWVK